MTGLMKLLKNKSNKSVMNGTSDNLKSLKKDHFMGIAFRLLLAACFSLVITSLALDFSSIPFAFWPQLAIACSVVFILAVVTWFWQAFLIVLGLIVLVFVSIWATGNLDLEFLAESIEYPSFWLEEAFYWLIAQPNYFPLDTLPLLGLAMGTLIAMGCYWLTARTCHPWLMLTVFAVLLITRHALGFEIAAAASIAGFIFVFIAFAFKQPGWNRNTRPNLISIQGSLVKSALLPIIAAVITAALLAQVISPAVITAVKRPQEWEDIASMLTIPGLNGSGTSNEFSIGTAGYYPLQNRLGGSVNLSDEPVFSVEGSADDMLFKGAVSVYYSGNSWERLPMDDAMRFNDEMHRQVRDSFLGANYYFEMTKISAALIEELISFDPDLYNDEELDELNTIINTEGHLSGGNIESKIYDVEFYKQGFRSVFYHGSPLDISLRLESETAAKGFDLFSELIEFDPTLFFNNGGAVYTTTPFSPGQGYRVIAVDRNINERAFSYWYRVYFGVDTSEREYNSEESVSSLLYQRYLQLPELPEYGVSGQLTELAREITADEKNQYDKAKAIETYLKDAASYALQVEMPPADREFVSWFLEQKEGYCVYFATALTMLCRLAGIPARYVEGYYVPASSDIMTTEAAVGNPPDTNERVITGQQAHAWTEVYIDEMGWMPMDATPGGGSAASRQIMEDIENPYMQQPDPSDISNQDDSSIVNSDSNQNVNLWVSIINAITDRMLFIGIVFLVVLLLVIIARLWIYSIERIFVEDWWLKKRSSTRLRIKLLFFVILRLLPENNKLWINGQAWSEFAKNSRYKVYSVTNGTIDAHEWEKLTIIFNESLYSNHEMKNSQWKLVWHMFSCMIQGLRERHFGVLRICVSILPLQSVLKQAAVSD